MVLLTSTVDFIFLAVEFGLKFCCFVDGWPGKSWGERKRSLKILLKLHLWFGFYKTLLTWGFDNLIKLYCSHKTDSSLSFFFYLLTWFPFGLGGVFAGWLWETGLPFPITPSKSPASAGLITAHSAVAIHEQSWCLFLNCSITTSVTRVSFCHSPKPKLAA